VSPFISATSTETAVLMSSSIICFGHWAKIGDKRLNKIKSENNVKIFVEIDLILSS